MKWLAPVFDALQTVDLSEAPLKRRAESRTGLGDWGEAPWDEGLRVVLRSLNEDARLSRIGRHLVQNTLVQALSVRLQLAAAVRAQPSVAAHPPRRPLVIASLPRTGSTLLQRLLAAHPAALSLPLWLQLQPFPAPTAAQWRRGGGWRLHQSRIPVALAQLLTPGATAKHRAGAALPEECGYLMLGSGGSVQFWSFWPVHGYVEWLRGADARPAYRFLRQALALLQQHLPEHHWVLKSPQHFLALDEVLRSLPEARVVLLHRDPCEAVPSTHSLIETMHRAVSDELDHPRTVATVTRVLAERANAVAELRDGPDRDRMLDVDYRELVADPVGTTRRIATWAEQPWSSDIERAVAARAAHLRPGRHRYSLARFEQSEEEIRRAFADYIARFRTGET